MKSQKALVVTMQNIYTSVSSNILLQESAVNLNGMVLLHKEAKEAASNRLDSGDADRRTENGVESNIATLVPFIPFDTCYIKESS